MPSRLRQIARTEEFDYNLLLHALADYKNPRVKINQMLKKGEIIRVKKGLYVFGPDSAAEPYSRETLANLIYGPSYISLEYALAFHGLIPERVVAVTSITNKRKKVFETPVGRFTYQYIHPRLFPLGITLHRLDDRHTILIASIEKAVSDMLYVQPKFADARQVQDYLSESLRMDSDALGKIRISRLKPLAALYGGNIQLLYTLLKEGS